MSASRYLRPDVIAQVQRLDLRARFIVEGFMAGLHSSPFQGFSVEFSEHRKYVPGDDLRTIDWNVLARTDRLHVKKYQAETNMEGYLLVDTSASMAYGGESGALPDSSKIDDAKKQDLGADAGQTDGPSDIALHSSLNKLDYAICLAAAMGYLMVQQQDAVGLGVFDSQLRTFLPPRARRSHLIRILAELANVRPSQDTDGKGLAAALHDMARRIHKRSLIVVFSDFLCDMPAVLEALHHLRFRNHDLIMFQVLDWTETQFPFEDPTRFTDPETGETISTQAEAIRDNYLTALREFIAEYRRACAAIRADFVTVDTAMTFDRALTQYLLERQRQF